MLHRLHQILFSRFVRCFFAVALIAAAWGWWWFGPAWPIRSHRFDDVLSVNLTSKSILTGNTWFDWLGPPDNRFYGYGLIRLSGGKVLYRQKQKKKGSWAVSPTNEYVVALVENGIRIIETATGIEKTASYGPNSPPSLNVQIRFCANGQRFAIESNVIDVFETSTGRFIAQVPNAQVPIDLSPDGRQLLALSPGPEPDLILVDIETGNELARVVDDQHKNLDYVRFSPKDDLAVGITNGKNQNSEIRVWSIPNLQRIATFEFPATPATQGSLWFSPNGRYLMIKATEPRLIDFSTSPPTDVTSRFISSNPLFSFCDNGSRFVTATVYDWTLFDAASGKSIISDSKTPTESIHLSPDGAWIGLVDSKPKQNAFVAWLHRTFGEIRAGGVTATFISAGSGRRALTIWDGYPIIFDNVAGTVWTLRRVADRRTLNLETLLEEWYLVRPLGTWWLWLLTSAGGVAMIWDIACALRRRGRHAPSPASNPV
jgi:hypothetical protein